jgi:hypothetical protein
MAGNDQDISQMTSVPAAAGDGDVPPIPNPLREGMSVGMPSARDPEIVNQALASAAPTPSAPIVPTGGLAALASQQAAPPTAQNSFSTQPNQTQDYLDQIMAIQKEIKNQTNSSQVPWFQLASAFLNPGKTGSFGEALGNAAGAMGKYQEEQQTRKLPLMQAGLKAEEIRQGIVNNQRIQDLASKAITTDKIGMPIADPAVLQQIAAIDPTRAAALQSIVQAQRTAMAPKEIKLGEGERLYTQSPISIDPKTGQVNYEMKESAAGASKLPEAVKSAMVANNIDPSTPFANLTQDQKQLIANHVATETMPTAIKEALPLMNLPIATDLSKLSPSQRQQLQNIVLTKVAAGATKVALNTAQTEQAELVKGLIPVLNKQVEVGQSIPTQIATIQRARKIFEDPKVIAGFGSGSVTNIENALATFGLKDPAVRDQTMKGLQAMAQITRDNLPLMKDAVGSRMTNMDVQLEKAAVGDLSMGLPAVKETLKLMEDTARERLKLSNSRVEQLSQISPNTKHLSDIFKTDIPAEYIPERGGIPTTTKENFNTEYSKIPSGSQYYDPTGTLRTKK